MAKMKRLKIGSVIKSKDPSKADYIKLDDKLPGGAITFKAGDYIQVESKAYQLSSLEKAVADGKLSEENAEKGLKTLLSQYMIGNYQSMDKSDFNFQLFQLLILIKVMIVNLISEINLYFLLLHGFHLYIYLFSIIIYVSYSLI
jgi:hypothetical protein